MHRIVATLCGIRIVCGPKFVHKCENAAAIIVERSLQNNNRSLGRSLKVATSAKYDQRS
jgi:hypothetical protein